AVGGAAADREDVFSARPAALVGRDAAARVELHARRLEPEPLDERRAPDGDEHQFSLDRLALAEMDGQARAVVVDARALLPEAERDPAPLELLRELLRGVGVL